MLLMIVPGCGTIDLNEQTRGTLHTVSIDPSVELPEKLNMRDEGLALMGVVGLVAAEVEGSSRESSMKGVMSSHGIDLGEMVRQEFGLALASSGLFAVGDPSASQATFHLKVFSLGMARPSGFTFELKPVVGIEGSLVDPRGSLLWRRRELTTNLSDETPAHSYDDYLADPARIRKAFEIAVRLTVKDLVLHLRSS